MKGQRKPTPLKILHGDDKKNPQRINRQEPKPLKKIPDCPAHLKGHARRKWTYTIKILAEMRILSAAELTILEQYCTTYDRWRRLGSDLEKEGVVLTSATGALVRNPKDATWIQLNSQLLRQGAELGLSYVSRAKMHADPEPEQPEGMQPRQRKKA